VAKGKLTIVVGAQFGGEGKGNITSHLAKNPKVCGVAVRVGGTNAGHTSVIDGTAINAHQIPVPCFVRPDVIGVIGAGGLVDTGVLRSEIEMCQRLRGWMPTIHIDWNATVIEKKHRDAEIDLNNQWGSTCSGTSAALADRAMRRAKLWKEMQATLGAEYSTVEGCDTPIKLIDAIEAGYPVLLEGTQGFGLGVSDGCHYPYCTSKNVSPMALLADAGLSWRTPSSIEVILCVRSYPTRIGGNSGHLKGEVDWEYMKRVTNGYVLQAERSTFANKVCRIAMIDYEDLGRTAEICKPTAVALTFFDYWYPGISNATCPLKLTSFMKDKIKEVETVVGCPVKYIGTGPSSVMEV